MVQMPPASVLASWPTPNYVNPVRQGSAVEIMNAIFYPIVCTIIILRIMTRRFISKSFGMDDYLIIAALVPTTAFAVVAFITELHYHLNRHVWDIPIADLTVGLKLILTSQIIFVLAQTLTKLSMLTLIYHVMSYSAHLQVWTKRIMIMVVTEGAIFITVAVFQCRPISAYWTLSFTPQKCINQPLHVLIASIINTCNDFLIVIFPIPTVLTLHIPRRQQIVAIFLFTGGFVACIAGGIRTYYTYKSLKSYDQSWESYGNWISSSVELYVGMICASIPATKPFFQRFLPTLLGSTARSRRDFSSNQDKTISSGVRSPNTDSQLEDVELGSIKSQFERLNTGADDKRQTTLENIIEVQTHDSDTSLSSFHAGDKGTSKIEKVDSLESEIELVIQQPEMNQR